MIERKVQPTLCTGTPQVPIPRFLSRFFLAAESGAAAGPAVCLHAMHADASQ